MKPRDMRFYCTLLHAEPVGPKAMHTMNGKVRRPHTLAEAEKATGWPALALVALYNATYPPTEGDGDPRLSDLAEAMFNAPVRDAMLHFYGKCGDVSAHTFLLCLLIQWDMGDGESKRDTLVEAIGFEPVESRAWFTGNREPVEGGEDVQP